MIMDRLTVPARLMIVSDLDFTMVDHHDPENISLLRFNALWESNYRHDSLLVFSTGRSPMLYKELRKEKPILTPDVAIMSVGTEITYGKSMVPDSGWEEFLNQNWDRSVVSEETAMFSELTLQPETEQRPHKVSFRVDKDKAQEVAKALLDRLKKRGLSVKTIYSGGMDLDVLPQAAGKGQALAYLHRKFEGKGKLPKNTLVCGDSGNDAELFSIPDVYGVMVGNAQEELLQWYNENAKDNIRIIHGSGRCAASIIQAIGHFCLGPNASPRDIADFTNGVSQDVNPAHGLVKFYLSYERWRRGEVQNPEKCVETLKEFLNPSGVLICPNGSELSFSCLADVIGGCLGDRKDKPFRIWLDLLLPSKTGPDTWCVMFDRWESFGNSRNCCATTALISSKEGGDPNRFVLTHMHQTWRDGYNPRNESLSLF